LRSFYPIWGGIAILISFMGILIGQLEEDLSVGEALYFAWVTGTTVGYGDLTPTTGSTRVLAIIVAILGIVLTGIIVTMAIEAAKIVVESNTSIQEFKQSIKERSKQRVSRNRETQPEQGDEER
jgi:hypothetical protein